jgi:SAM-dependent methyltransferase
MSQDRIIILNDFKKTKCPFCGVEIKSSEQVSLKNRGAKTFSSVDIYLEQHEILSKCSACRSYFKQNIINPNQLEMLYIQGNSTGAWSHSNFATEKGSEIVIEIEACVGKDLKVLDIGCNSGELLDFCKKLGAITYGIELSEEAKLFCTKKGHQMIENLQGFEKTFDVICAFDLLEHINEPSDFLESLSKSLKNEGKLIILTGNPNSFSARVCGIKWWYFSYPEHIVFPSKKYFDLLTNYKIEKNVSVYNSRDYKYPIFKLIKSLVSNILFKRKYNGVPSIFPDHQLVVLKRKP